MPFTEQHLYLTLHWVPGEQSTETGQVGFRFSMVGDASQALVDAAAPAVQTFWQSAGALIGTDFSLKFIRLATIGTDGRYPAGKVAYDHTYGTGIIGGNSQVIWPLQVASVATLTTPTPRGQAHSGRVYLPPIAAALDSSSHWANSATTGRATALATMLSSLNAGIFAPGARALVMSKSTKTNPNGLSNIVTGVKVGGRPDVQRRRAKKQLEIYSPTQTVAAP